MHEYKDYSGEFRSDAKLQDFSKDAILRLWRTSSLIYMMLGGLWFDVVKDHVGIEKALEWEKEVWLIKRGIRERYSSVHGRTQHFRQRRRGTPESFPVCSR
ncbi:MAG: hypothetical protein HQ553_04175 [Chloroflexi bacterium]|nr:hypothetical protein [Chloroflexota bacterium]